MRNRKYPLGTMVITAVTCWLMLIGFANASGIAIIEQSAASSGYAYAGVAAVAEVAPSSYSGRTPE